MSIISKKIDNYLYRVIREKLTGREELSGEFFGGLFSGERVNLWFIDFLFVRLNFDFICLSSSGWLIRPGASQYTICIVFSD